MRKTKKREFVVQNVAGKTWITPVLTMKANSVEDVIEELKKQGWEIPDQSSREYYY